MKPAGILLSCVAAAAAIAAGCAASSFGETIQADANGNLFVDGVAGPHGIGGSDNPVTYTLPFVANAGDAVLADGIHALALIRFHGDDTMDFYSKDGSLLAAAGATNIKVQSTFGFQPGQQIYLDAGANQELVTIASVGTAGAGGTGITLASPLTSAHASGSDILRSPLYAGSVVALPPAGPTRVGLTDGDPTPWTPGATGIGGNPSDPSLQYLFFNGNNPVAAAPLPPPAFAGLALMIAVGGSKGWHTRKRAAKDGTFAAG
jgi:hypothetical protein